MIHSTNQATNAVADPSLAFPLAAELWQVIVTELELSPQQERVARLLLLGYGDKEIAAELKLKLSTTQTYLSRIFQRLNITKRMHFATHVMKLAVHHIQANPCQVNQRQANA